MSSIRIERAYIQVILPTWYSWGASFPSLAFLARVFVSEEMVAKPFEPASLMIGVIKPEGVATATEISAFLYLFVQALDNFLEDGGKGVTFG